jgi:hypothetical protein
MFALPSGEVVLNEVAPRVHNTGAVAKCSRSSQLSSAAKWVWASGCGQVSSAAKWPSGCGQVGVVAWVLGLGTTNGVWAENACVTHVIALMHARPETYVLLRRLLCRCAHMLIASCG